MFNAIIYLIKNLMFNTLKVLFRNYAKAMFFIILANFSPLTLKVEGRFLKPVTLYVKMTGYCLQ